MKSSPIGGLFGNKMTNQEPTYANVVLQSLASLDTTKDIFLKREIPYKNQTSLTKQFFGILNIIHNYMQDVCSLEIVNTYFNYANSINEATIQYPYNFLVYFLIFLDQEYNRAFNIPNDFPKNSSANIEKIANEINNTFSQVKRSMIIENYFFTIILNSKCTNCGTSKYDWALKRIVDLDIDKYKEWKRGPVTLNECLQYYILGKSINCQNCGNINSTQSRLFFNTGKVLIINLIRKMLTGQTDQFFHLDTNINISGFKKDSFSSKNNNYSLKARILFAGQQYGYCADCFIKKDNMQGVWYRYLNDNKREIQPQEINQYESILLFYESYDNDQLNNNNNNINSNIPYNNVNNINMNMNFNMGLYGANNNMNFYNNMNQNMNYQRNNMNPNPVNNMQPQSNNFSVQQNQPNYSIYGANNNAIQNNNFNQNNNNNMPQNINNNLNTNQNINKNPNNSQNNSNNDKNGYNFQSNIYGNNNNQFLNLLQDFL